MGKFYGNNHTIKNLTITSLSDTTMVGLFGLVKNGEIHDLYLTDVNIKLDKFNVAGTDQVGYGTLVSNVYGNDTTYIISNVHVSNVQVYGPSSSRVTLPSGMIGIVYGRAEIDNCWVDNAYVEGYPNSTGGLLAEVSNGAGKYLKITNSSVSNTTLVNGTHTGAIIGYWGSVTGDSHLMENCYSNNVVFVNTNVNVGGLVGRTDGAVLKIIRNCYSVTSSKNTNTEAKTVMITSHGV